MTLKLSSGLSLIAGAIFGALLIPPLALAGLKYNTYTNLVVACRSGRASAEVMKLNLNKQTIASIEVALRPCVDKQVIESYLAGVGVPQFVLVSIEHSAVVGANPQ